MRILYLSCHSILEFDEVRLLHELGHKVFSPGAYVEPRNPGDASLRPGIEGLEYDRELLDILHRIGQNNPGKDSKDNLSEELMSHFDTVIVMHLPRWIHLNWNVFKGKRVIWRTIGQSLSNVEAQLQPFRSKGLEVVRYSPKERNIPGFIGEDALIRFYKDPNEYGPWNGNVERVITFAQSMKDRGPACNFNFFESVTRPFNRHLFGPGNENVGSWATGKVPFERLVEEMKSNRVYFYTGTHPASYTLNFMEAWMTGIPVVAIGHSHGNASYFPGHDLYEVPELIKHHEDGFVSDDPNELRHYINLLMNDHAYAAKVGQAGRESAIKFFGKETIKQAWKNYLGE